MKKLALIILIALYGLAITGAGIVPAMAGGNTVCTHSDGLAAVNNGDDAGSCGSETCNTGYTGFTVKEHQHATRPFHFSSRNVVKDNEGCLPTATPLIQLAGSFAANTRVPGATVPAYILHCVYRL